MLLGATNQKQIYLNSNYQVVHYNLNFIGSTFYLEHILIYEF